MQTADADRGPAFSYVRGLVSYPATMSAQCCSGPDAALLHPCTPPPTRGTAALMKTREVFDRHKQEEEEEQHIPHVHLLEVPGAPPVLGTTLHIPEDAQTKR